VLANKQRYSAENAHVAPLCYASEKLIELVKYCRYFCILSLYLNHLGQVHIYIYVLLEQRLHHPPFWRYNHFCRVYDYHHHHHYHLFHSGRSAHKQNTRRTHTHKTHKKNNINATKKLLKMKQYPVDYNIAQANSD